MGDVIITSKIRRIVFFLSHYSMGIDDNANREIFLHKQDIKLISGSIVSLRGIMNDSRLRAVLIFMYSVGDERGLHDLNLNDT